MKVVLSILSAALCACMAATPLVAASAPAAKTDKQATAPAAVRTAWPPESISGKILMVNPDRKLVVVETPAGVPFDMMVTGKTRIKSGDRTISLQDLKQDMDKSVSVRFTPERRGDVARSIDLNG